MLAITDVKKMTGLTDKQNVELCDTIGKMLVTELDTTAVKTKVQKLVTDYVKKNKIDVDPKGLSTRLHWHVQVLLKK
jgi:hypothetical protein